LKPPRYLLPYTFYITNFMFIGLKTMNQSSCMWNLFVKGPNVGHVEQFSYGTLDKSFWVYLTSSLFKIQMSIVQIMKTIMLWSIPSIRHCVYFVACSKIFDLCYQNHSIPNMCFRAFLVRLVICSTNNMAILVCVCVCVFLACQGD
jgi:hypothetical protein